MSRNELIRALKVMIVLSSILFGLVVILASMNTDNNVKIRQLTEQIRILEQSPEQAPEQIPEPSTEQETEQGPEETTEQADMEYVGEFKCTAYCTEKYEHICGTGCGITASGQPVQAGITVAVGDTDRFPYGTVLYIEGVGTRVVQDTGGGLADNQIDLALSTHEEALNWGCKDGVKVYVVRGGVE